MISFQSCKQHKTKRLRSKFFISVENRNFEDAYQYLAELKALRGQKASTYYLEELLKIRIPYLLENDAPEVAIKELSEYKVV